MIYEARVTGKYETRYWVQIPTKYGQQDVGPIKATGLVSPTIGQIVYVGYLPTADTFVILAGPEGVGVVSWGDIANKPSTFTPASHNHAASNITSGTLAAARLPVVTSSANGAMLAADKAKLDAATINSTANTIAMRDANGLLATQAPTGPTHAANKSYVDAQDALRAPLSHTHTWGQITGKPSTFEPSAHTHAWAEITSKPSTFTPSTHTHTWGQITGVPTTFEPSAHTHAWAEITSKPTTFAPSSHNHAASNITSGTLAAARLPVVTTTANGAMLAADKVKLDNAGYAAGGSTIMMTSSADYAKAGAFFVSLDQQGQAHSLTRKDYVDAHVAGLQAGKLDKALIEIGDAANLNDYVTTGDYHQGANVRAGNGTNYPTPYAGKLEVKASDSGMFVYQEYTSYLSAGRKFYRCKYSSTWYSWKEIGVRTVPAKWSNVSINTSDFALYDSASYATITEDNGLVTLSATLKPTSTGVPGLNTTGGAHALTIPSQYVPSATKALIWVMQSSGSDHVTGSLEPDGRFTIGRHTGTPSTSSWLPIYVHWRL